MAGELKAPAVLPLQDPILIIDDSVETIRLLAGMLHDLGSILFATNGRDGIELARQRKPALILLDVEMEGMDGYETCRELLQEEETRHCAVMFVTANTDAASEIKALELGAVDFIPKPVNPMVARARVSTQIKLYQHAAALAQLANKDGLTGLFNRRYFDEQLHREFMRHKRQSLPLALAFIDIDHFKRYNDGYGHLEGDACLKQVATALAGAAQRPGEVAARYGGEEFVVILPYTDAAEAQKYGEWVCGRIRALELKHDFATDSGGESCIVTVSVGLASIVPSDIGDEKQLLALADQALYLAKRAGRDRAMLQLASSP
jgi:diguanylate cyclase (GGDEF)-like protein